MAGAWTDPQSHLQWVREGITHKVTPVLNPGRQGVSQRKGRNVVVSAQARARWGNLAALSNWLRAQGWESRRVRLGVEDVARNGIRLCGARAE